MTFADIISTLKIADVRKKYALDNIAWILNCVPLRQDQEQQLKSELDMLCKNRNVGYTVVNGFVMLQSY